MEADLAACCGPSAGLTGVSAACVRAHDPVVLVLYRAQYDAATSPPFPPSLPELWGPSTFLVGLSRG